MSPNLRHRVEARLAKLCVGAVEVLPPRLSLAVARVSARLAFRFQGERARRAAAWAQRTLGVSAQRARHIVREACESLAMNMVEPTLLERALRRGEPLERFVTIEGAEHLHAAIASGRGVLLCSAHFGAWEVSGIACRERFQSVWAMAQPRRNPLLTEWIEQRRSPGTQGQVHKHGGLHKLARLLREGQSVFLLLDQNAGRGGVVLDFLGYPSSHHKLAGLMSRLGARILPMYVLREPGTLRFRLVLEAPVERDPALTGEAAEVDVVERVSRRVEEWVRSSPEQWLWLHDRWGQALRTRRREIRAASVSTGLGSGLARGTNKV